LSNPTASPAEYDEYSARLLQSIEDANKLGDTQTHDLDRLLEMAKAAKKAADEKSDLWKKFKRLRDDIGDKQDQIQNSHEDLKDDGEWPLSEMGSVLKAIEVNH
jgi:predicted  nucleic acid-binding Zn-ribbon protein